MIGEFIDTMANLEYGILLAIVIDAILLFCIASINSKKKLNVLSYIIAIVLLVPLTFQMSRLIGAFNVSSAASTATDIIGVVSPTLSKYVSSATSHEIGWFIFRRVLWSVLFTLLAGVAIFVTMDKQTKRSRDIPSGAQMGRRYTSSTNRRRR